MIKKSLLGIALFAADPIAAHVLVPRVTVPPARLKTVPKITTIVPLAKIEIYDLPVVSEIDSAAKRTDPKAIWSVTRTAPMTGPQGAIGTQIRSTVYRKRTGVFAPQRGEPTCGTLFTAMDIVKFRHNGFHLASARVDPIIPSGFTLTEPPTLSFGVRRPPRGTNNAEVPMEQAEIVHLHGPIAERRLPLPVPMAKSMCHSEYYLHLTLIGPKGIDPYTGKPYPPRSPVN